MIASSFIDELKEHEGSLIKISNWRIDKSLKNKHDKSTVLLVSAGFEFFKGSSVVSVVVFFDGKIQNVTIDKSVTDLL
jgi:DNA-binding protein YbaB